MAQTRENLSYLCAAVARLAAWLARQPAPPVIYAAYHRTYSTNRPSSYLGLTYQDGAVCPWWRLGGVRHEFPPHHLVLLSSHLGSRSAPVTGDGGLWVCTFDLAGVDGFADLIAAYRWAPVPIRHPARLLPAYRQVAEAYLLERPSRDLHLQAALLHFCATVLDDLRGDVATTDAVTAVLAHIHAHYRDPALDLPTLAAVGGLSRHHFGRVFRAATGTSPMHYVQQIRLRQARALMETTTLRVKEVAREVGFGDPLHFSRAFRALHGHSPRQHRQRPT